MINLLEFAVMWKFNRSCLSSLRSVSLALRGPPHRKRSGKKKALKGEDAQADFDQSGGCVFLGPRTKWRAPADGPGLWVGPICASVGFLSIWGTCPSHVNIIIDLLCQTRENICKPFSSFNLSLDFFVLGEIVFDTGEVHQMPGSNHAIFPLSGPLAGSVSSGRRLAGERLFRVSSGGRVNVARGPRTLRILTGRVNAYASSLSLSPLSSPSVAGNIVFYGAKNGWLDPNIYGLFCMRIYCRECHLFSFNVTELRSISMSFEN